jgi:hypothetical protein
MGDPSAYLHSLRRFEANHRKDFIEGSRVWTQLDWRLLGLMPIGVHTMGVHRQLINVKDDLSRFGG